MRFLSAALVLLATEAVSAWEAPIERKGFNYYVTRPELRAPKWDIDYYNKEALAPGYWIISTYTHFGDLPGNAPCENGPFIYDNDGELIWSGACRFNNHDSWDWNEVTIRGETFLKGQISGVQGPMGGVPPLVGFFLGEDYETENKMVANSNWDTTDPHEFNVIDQGTDFPTALITMKWTKKMPAVDFGFPKANIHARIPAIREVDVRNGAKLFEWHFMDHINLNESTFHIDEEGYPRHHNGLGKFDPNEFADDPKHDIFGFTEHKDWDAFHINAVDKKNGHYLVSLRHADTLYLISQETRQIIWRFGGRMDDFKHIGDFVFSRQHNCRFISHEKDRSVITFLDNGVAGTSFYTDWGQPATNEVSRGLMVELHHPPGAKHKWSAKILHEYVCPDGCVAYKRGDVQVLDNNNVFMGWTIANGHISEFSENGTVLMDARFVNEYYETYRMFKLQAWKGRPTTKPDIVAQTRGINEYDGATTIYVSWHGSTEHKSWEFYENDELIGSMERNGFETAYTTLRPLNGKLTAKALDAGGVVLSTSKWVWAQLQDGWIPKQRPDGVVFEIPEELGGEKKHKEVEEGGEEEEKIEEHEDVTTTTTIGDDDDDGDKGGDYGEGQGKGEGEEGQNQKGDDNNNKNNNGGDEKTEEEPEGGKDGVDATGHYTGSDNDDELLDIESEVVDHQETEMKGEALGDDDDDGLHPQEEEEEEEVTAEESNEDEEEKDSNWMTQSMSGFTILDGLGLGLIFVVLIFGIIAISNCVKRRMSGKKAVAASSSSDGGGAGGKKPAWKKEQERKGYTAVSSRGEEMEEV